MQKFPAEYSHHFEAMWKAMEALSAEEPVAFEAISRWGKYMRNLKWLGATVITGFAVCSLSAADANNWYFNADAGGNFVQDIRLRIVEGHAEGHANVSFDPGMRLDLSGGYKLSESFALELETGFTYNQIHKFAGRSVSSDNNLYQVPILLNVAYSHALNNKWSIYGSLGAGAGIDTLDFRSANPLDIRHGSDTDCTLDYQASLGVKYAISQNCDLGLGYKFFGTTENEWKIKGVTRKTDEVFNHSILLNFTYKF